MESEASRKRAYERVVRVLTTREWRLSDVSRGGDLIDARLACEHGAAGRLKQQCSFVRGSCKGSEIGWTQNRMPGSVVSEGSASVASVGNSNEGAEKKRSVAGIRRATLVSPTAQPT